jgi:hypothetical protein
MSWNPVFYSVSSSPPVVNILRVRKTVSVIYGFEKSGGSVTSSKHLPFDETKNCYPVANIDDDGFGRAGKPFHGGE